MIRLRSVIVPFASCSYSKRLFLPIINKRSNYISSYPLRTMAFETSSAKLSPEITQNTVDVGSYNIDTKVIGFIGLGNMGGRVTTNLCKKGYTVVGYDVSPKILEIAVKNGVKPASSVAEVAKQATTIMTSVPEAKHLASILYGPEGVFANAKKGTYIMDMSTIGYYAAKEFYEEAAKVGHSFMDTPVTGGVAGAEKGTLTFMISGTEHQYNEVQKLYKDIGKTFVHCGGPAMGSVAKICNNMILGTSMIGTCEAMQLAVHFGIDVKILTTVLVNGSANGYPVTVMHPIPGYATTSPNAPPDNDYKNGFGVDLMKKDLGIGIDNAIKAGFKAPYAALAMSEYEELSKRGYGHLDFTVQYKHGGAKIAN